MTRRSPLLLIPRPVMGDGPSVEAARIMGLSRADFEKELPQLLGRRFPRPDPTTGLFDLDAIVKWREQRYPDVYPDSAAPIQGPSPGAVIIAERLRKAREDLDRRKPTP